MTSKSNRLDEIMAHKAQEMLRLEPHAAELKKLALMRNDIRGFKRRLEDPNRIHVIAEVKKASPSAGDIRANVNPVAQAQAYASAGAEAISVLTDERFFKGHLDDLRKVRPMVNVPVLRKDFMMSRLQIYEACVAGADAILLIVAALRDEVMRDLYNCALDLQLDVLVEVHNLEEMDRALDLGADIIGINNRNLQTFEVSLETTARLAEEIPSDCLAISESGIRTRADIDFCRSYGISCFLIGEALMRSEDPAAALQDLIGLPLKNP